MNWRLCADPAQKNRAGMGIGFANAHTRPSSIAPPGAKACGGKSYTLLLNGVFHNGALFCHQPVFAAAHVGAQGHVEGQRAFHLLAQDVRGLQRFALGAFHYELVVHL